jgi:hypothetical protein
MTEFTENERKLVMQIAKLEMQLRISQGRIAGLMSVGEQEEEVAKHVEGCINCHGVQESDALCPEGQRLLAKVKHTYTYLREMPAPPEAAVMAAATLFHDTWHEVQARAKREGMPRPDPETAASWEEMKLHSQAQVNLLSSIDLLNQVRDGEFPGVPMPEGPLQ